MLFRLPYWLFLVLGLLCIPLAFMAKQATDKFVAERTEALRIGPPPVVDISRFDPERDTGPADEVNIRAQLDMSMSYQLIRTKDGDVKDRAQMIPLYPVDATSAVEAPLAIMLEKLKGLDYDPALFDFLIAGSSVGEGPLGPIIELNGRLRSPGKLKSQITSAFGRENRAYLANVPVIDPFLESRAKEFSTRVTSFMVVSVILGIGALFLLIGFIKKRRRTARMAAEEASENADASHVVSRR